MLLKKRGNVEKETIDTTLYGLLITIALGVFGALARLLFGWKGGKLTRADYRNIFIDIFGSVFISIVVYMLAVWWFNLHPMAAAAFGSLAGHLGTRATILFIQDYVKRKLK